MYIENSPSFATRQKRQKLWINKSSESKKSQALCSENCDELNPVSAPLDDHATDIVFVFYV